MYSDKQKNEFALLRAEGVSFNSISNKLNVPLRTLFRWAKDMSDDICDMKIVAYESVADSLKTSVNKRIQSLIKDLNQIDKNIKDKGFSFISTPTLLKMKINIHNELVKYENKIYSPSSVKKSQTVAPVDMVTDDMVTNDMNKSNSDEKNSGEKNSGESDEMS